LFAGTLDERGARRRAALYRIDPGFVVSQVCSEITLANGLGWSPDGGTMYFIDTMTHGVDAYAYDADTGAMGKRRCLVSIPPDGGLPDGLAVDAEGHLWVALWGGGRVERYSPSGEPSGAIALPARQVTNCCFGGPGLDELYLTSARQGLGAGELHEEPLAGALFRARVDVAGLPPASTVLSTVA
jgi:sugar lactone lactonase YvrE